MKGQPMPPPPPPPPPPPTPAPDRALGGPPLIPGDDRTGYDALLAGVAATVGPADLIEQAWVRDVVDLIFEAVRLRRLKAALMTSGATDGMQQVLGGLNPRTGIYELAHGWAARELAAVAHADQILDAAGLGIDHVMAQTLRLLIDEIERIDRMVASAEARRAATLREIAAYRAEFAARLRGAAAAAIEDAEFEVVGAAGAAAEDAAE
jgi:hypothetical protein